MKLSTASLALLIGLTLSSCVIVIGGRRSRDHVRGSGVSVEETREVEDFTEIKLMSVGDATVRVGEATSLVVRGDDNLLPELRTTVEDGTLLIRLPDHYRPRTTMRFTIGAPSLDRVAVYGAGDIELSGASGDSLAFVIEGSGDIEASGKVDELSVDIDGSGDVALEDLHAREASVKISGSGDVSVHASETLDYSISGSGDIVVHGGAHTSGSVSGSGSLRHE